MKKKLIKKSSNPNEKIKRANTTVPLKKAGDRFVDELPHPKEDLIEGEKKSEDYMLAKPD